MAIRAGRVGVGSGQLGLVNMLRVKTGHFLMGQSGRGLSWVELTRIFQTFFFLEIDAIYQLFMNSLTVIRFSLMKIGRAHV